MGDDASKLVGGLEGPEGPGADARIIAGIGAEDVREAYRRRGLDAWSDHRLVEAVAGVISVPKVGPADSFVLHAPLELLARASLLRYVRPAARDGARERLLRLGVSYAAAGEEVEADRSPVRRDRSAGECALALASAVAAGDLEDVDRLAIELGQRATPRDIRTLLSGNVVPCLSAAAHAPILLQLWVRVAPTGGLPGGLPGGLLRGPARELARHPGWRLGWFDELGRPSEEADASRRVAEVNAASLQEALLDVPSLGRPGSAFIQPMMVQAETSGVAARGLGPVFSGRAVTDVPRIRATLARVAAWSMLQEPPDHVPYGWTHCLTIPQAVMDLAGDGVGPWTASVVAATHVVGFRAALGRERLDPDDEPDRPEPRELDGEDLVAALATRASLHHEAHFVKYTLACFDAAAQDAEARHLYLASAASLARWWAEQPGDGFFG